MILNENHYIISNCLSFEKPYPISQRWFLVGSPMQSFPHYYLHNLYKYLQFRTCVYMEAVPGSSPRQGEGTKNLLTQSCA